MKSSRSHHTTRAPGASPTSVALVNRSASAEERREKSREAAACDAQLVERVRGGDQAAFEEIVTRYREKMLYVALALIRDRHDAEEIVQDTFVRAHRGIHRFRGDCSLVTWLHRITVNLARNRYWYFQRRARHATFSLDGPLTSESEATFSDVFASEAAGPARQATTDEFTEIVTACMEKLDPAHRQILTLRNILNHSYGEIARTLGIEEGTVKSRIARARGCLRNLMAEVCPEFSPDAAPSEWLDLRDPQLAETGRRI
jgi:RNA polymerase sigma-70 factor, ECF subfamily